MIRPKQEPEELTRVKDVLGELVKHQDYIITLDMGDREILCGGIIDIKEEPDKRIVLNVSGLPYDEEGIYFSDEEEEEEDISFSDVYKKSTPMEETKNNDPFEIYMEKACKKKKSKKKNKKEKK